VSLDLTRPIVYLITTGECDVTNYVHASQRLIDVVTAAVEAGVDLIQLREKRLTGKLLFELTQNVAEISSGSRTKLLVNDRLDIAVAAGADGVQLTSTSIAVASVRPRVPDDFMIGVSCHSAADVSEAERRGADFALFGPVFASPGKGDGVGLATLREICRAAPNIPIFAIGGVDQTNYQSVLHAEAAGFAAIRALNDVASMMRIMKELGR
jgi:thiamine-phosphate pyrophosphorylase